MTEERFTTISTALAAMPHLPAMLGGRVLEGALVADATFLAWGDRPLAHLATALARLRGRPILRLEDGFLRSVGLGKAGVPTVSIIADRQGMHFDARRASDIESLLNRPTPAEPARQARAAALVEAITQARLDKYNLPRDPMADPSLLADRILLVDQVHGDRSIAGAGANQATFLAMLDRAIHQYGTDRLAVKTHPDVMAGYARGNLAEAARSRGIMLFHRQIGIDDLAGIVDSIWTVSSTIGFEGLMRGIPITTFGMPFYAGWGLTVDRAQGRIAEAARKRRHTRPTLLDMVAAVFFDYTRFADPWRAIAISPEEGIDLLSRWKIKGAPPYD